MKKILLAILICGSSILLHAQNPITNQLMSSNAVWVFVTSYVQSYVATNPVNVQITNLALSFNTNYFVVTGTNVSINPTNSVYNATVAALTNGQSVATTFSNNVTIKGNLIITNNGNSVMIRSDGTIGATGSITNAGNIQTLLSMISYGGFQFGSFPGLNTNFQVYSAKQTPGSLKTNSFGTKGGILYQISN